MTSERRIGSWISSPTIGGAVVLLTHLDPASSLAVGLLVFSFVLVVLFEASNGFHDTANAVATVIYTKSLPPVPAVIWSGLMNFLGVLVGGIAVAYALVELLPPEVLSPPSGAPAVAMLVALFLAALVWNVGTWWFGLPNSSSHCLIGSLIGIAVANAFIRERNLGQGVHWAQMWTVLEALALSPVLGFIFAGALYFAMSKLVRDRHLYEPAKDGHTPVWWVRGLLILTCTGVSLSHGSNDGQKSIGLIMLTIIGLFPATYALNPQPHEAADALPQLMRQAEPLIEKYGDDEKAKALEAARTLANSDSQARSGRPAALEAGPTPAATQRSSVRDDVYQVISELKRAQEDSKSTAADKKQAKDLAKRIGQFVEYAPFWVRMLSAICLGVGTMIGYKRIVTTLGERLGKVHLTPAQGAATEVVSAILIGSAGFTGFPVSTTHIVTAGIGGTMVASGAGLNYQMIRRVLIAWVFTLPVTIVVAGTLYYFLASPKF
jgi:inorganic phosphate transporter, PiT family